MYDLVSSRESFAYKPSDWDLDVWDHKTSSKSRTGEKSILESRSNNRGNNQKKNRTLGHPLKNHDKKGRVCVRPVRLFGDWSL